MERLTDKAWGNLDPWECCGQDHYCQRGCHDAGGCTKGCIVPMLYKRLARYEDTGMEPERVEELAQAEKDGRLAVLPCKVGDTVWANIAIVGDRYRAADKPYPVEVVFIGMGGDDGFFHVQYSNGRIFPFDFDKVGKTVFLTREEAEAALKKREEIGWLKY